MRVEPLLHPYREDVITDLDWRTRLKVGPPEQRLWARVRKTDTCWEWQGHRNSKGYGLISVGSRADGTKRAVLTHRLAWELAHGPIPDGLWVCHSCDNPPCCRVDHLFLGDDAANAADREGKGRNRPPTGERVHTAKLVPDDVRRIRALHAAGEDSYRVLALRYGVSKQLIAQIVLGRVWKDVE